MERTILNEGKLGLFAHVKMIAQAFFTNITTNSQRGVKFGTYKTRLFSNHRKNTTQGYPVSLLTLSVADE